MIVNEKDICSNKSKDKIKWYNKFKLFGKIFNKMSKNSDDEKKEYFVYYCHFHITTIDSDIYFENWK